MVARTETRMASVLLACLLALLAPLRVAAQCTPLGVSVEFVAPSDSEHVLATDDAEVAKNTALCHVQCLNWVLSGGKINVTNGTNGTNSTVTKRSAGSAELTAVDDDIIELNCIQFKQYLDCRYGCVLQSQGQSDCGTTCHSRCTETLCPGFGSCFSSNDYVCGLSCSDRDCGYGCGLYNKLSNRSENFVAPTTAPDLVLMNGTTHAYEVAIPEELRLFDTPSLVFRIEDQSSPGDYVYQWTVDVYSPTFNNVRLKPPVVDLAAYSCRTVNVSYAYATTLGLTEYSTATVIDAPGNQTIPECTVLELEDSEVEVTYVPDERAGFFTHVVWNVTWNLTSCEERVTGFTVTLDPQGNPGKDCGESFQQTVEKNTSSVSFRSSVEKTLDLPCNYVLKVQVNPLDQGTANTKRFKVTVNDFTVPELEIVGCPVVYQPNRDTYEVNFQWRAPFSRALLSFINRFQITAFPREGGNSIPQAALSPESEIVNINYDPLHNHIQTLPPFENKNRFYRIGIEVFWKSESLLSALSDHCDTVDTPFPPPDPIENIYDTSYTVVDVQRGRTQTVDVAVSFSWDEPELNYNGKPIQKYQAHLAQEPLDPDSEGEAITDIPITSPRGSINRFIRGLHSDTLNFTVYLQVRSYQFEDLPSNWSDPQPINVLVPASAITGVEIDNQNINIEYRGGIPNVMFSATVRWDAEEVDPPITVERYDVWVNTEEADDDSSETIPSNVAERNVTRRPFPLLKESLDLYIQVRSVIALSSVIAESSWSEVGGNIISINSLPVPAGLAANFSNPRLTQQPSESTFSLSVKISVQWEPLVSADDVTGYEVYIGYEELRPYDMFQSASAVEKRSTSLTTEREQIVVSDTTQMSYIFNDTVSKADNVIFIQVRAVSGVYTQLPQWSEPILLNLTHLPPPGLATADLESTSLKVEDSEHTITAAVNMSWEKPSNDEELDVLQAWIGSKSLGEFEEPDLIQGAVLTFETNSTSGLVEAEFTTDSPDVIVYTQMRSVGPQGAPRWSEAISHRTGPVPPPTILNFTVTSVDITEDEVKEELQVEVVVQLEWEVPGFSNSTDGPGTTQIVPTPTPTPEPNATREARDTSEEGSEFGSGSGSASGDIPELDIELGSLTNISGYVGVVELDDFAVADQERVIGFKSDERSGEMKQTFTLTRKGPEELELFIQMQARAELGFPQWSEAMNHTISLRRGPTTGAVADDSSDDSLPIILGVSVPVLALLLIAIIVIATVLIRKRLQFVPGKGDDFEDHILQMDRPLLGLAGFTGKGPILDEWEISTDDVIVEQQLGEGAFGEVYKGVIRGPLENPKISAILRQAIGVPVAIKLLKPSSTGKEKSDFLAEIDMMKKIAEGYNPHIVNMVGCVTLQEPLCLITEFVPYGDLLSYLKYQRKKASEMRRREKQQLESGGVMEPAPYLEANSEYSHLEPLPEHVDENSPYKDLGDIEANDLIKFAYQIATGMEYLASLNIVHRDLACRNVLIAKDKLLKITDFGLSREVEEVYVKKTRGRLPLKWMAIESVTAREFTTASDVWAFGVTLWEIGTIGGFPYPSIQNEDLLMMLKQGYRLEKPENCAPEVYDLMLECWHEDPHDRPHFSDLRSKFATLLQAGSADAYIELQIDERKPYYQVKEEETGERRGSVSSTSSEESIDKEKGKEKEKAKRKFTNPYVTRPGQGQENGDAYFDTLGPAPERPQQLGIPISQLVPQAPQQTPVAASPLDEANAHGVLERRTTNPYVEEPAPSGPNVPMSLLAETPQLEHAANGLPSLDEDARDTTTV